MRTVGKEHRTPVSAFRGTGQGEIVYRKSSTWSARVDRTTRAKCPYTEEKRLGLQPFLSFVLLLENPQVEAELTGRNRILRRRERGRLSRCYLGVVGNNVGL